MTTTLVSLHPKLLLRGVRLDLTSALKEMVESKISRLLRHEPAIIRVRVDLELDQTRGRQGSFLAKGHLEVRGKDLLASVASEDCYKSIDLLIDRLDSMLRRRSGRARAHRHAAQLTDLPPGLPIAAG